MNNEFETKSGVIGNIDPSADGICLGCVERVVDMFDSACNVPTFFVESENLEGEDEVVLTVLASGFSPSAASITSLLHLGSEPPFLLAIDNGDRVVMTTRSGAVLSYGSSDVAGEMLSDMECSCGDYGE